MIFAAGFGTRMRPLTDDLPKPMISLCGRPMIDYTIEAAQGAGAKSIVVNTHYKPQPLHDHLKDQPVKVIHEAPHILDTGGGLRHALDHLGGDPVWTFNPDVVWSGPNPLTFAAEHWAPDRMEALLVCVPIGSTRGVQGSGDFDIAADGQLKRGGEFVYGGVHILKTEHLFRISETVFSLNAVWDLLIAEGRCFGCRYPGLWADVGRPENIPVAEALLRGDHNA